MSFKHKLTKNVLGVSNRFHHNKITQGNNGHIRSYNYNSKANYSKNHISNIENNNSVMSTIAVSANCGALDSSRSTKFVPLSTQNEYA